MKSIKFEYEPIINPEGKTIRGISPLNKETHWLYDFDEDCDSFFECFNNIDSELYQTNICNDTKYIFRGHQYSYWDLLPSVFRNLNSEEKRNDLNTLRSGNGHILPELKDFLNFIRGLNSLGYKIEDESFKLINSKLVNDHHMSFDLNIDFPKESQLKELALAQHYGVQTRLLDFTFNPNKAIFFATEKVRHPNREDDSKIGIWAIPKRLIDISSDDFFIQQIFIQGFQNKNMVAQEGLFINYFNGRTINQNLYNEQGKIKKLDEYLFESKRGSINGELVNKNIGKPCLFTLSHRAVWQAAKKIELMNINWITIQPDLDGVKKEVERKRRNSNL